jgi:hypothetical protein
MAIKIQGSTIIDDNKNIQDNTGFYSDANNSAMRPKANNSGQNYLQVFNTTINNWDSILVAGLTGITCSKIVSANSGLTVNNAVLTANSGLTVNNAIAQVNNYLNSWNFYGEINGNTAMRSSQSIFGQIGSNPGNNNGWQSAFIGKFELFPYWSQFNRLMLETSFIKCQGGLAINTSQPMPFHGGDGQLTVTPVYISDSGGLTWSFSSRRNKTNIEDIDIDYKKILNLRPVIYEDLWIQHPEFDEETNRIKIDKLKVGLIAEEVYEEIPEICEFGYHYLDQEEVCDYDECCNETNRRRVVKECVEKQPINVNYDRLSVLIVGLLKEMNADIEFLKEEVQTLKASLQTP